MEYHPYSEIWPLLEGAEFEKLKTDIEANGLLLPIITYKGKILDGRNRKRACDATGRRVRYEEAKAKTDDEALRLVVSLNDHRRHLSLAQRSFAAAKLANIMHGHNQFVERGEDRPDDLSSPSTVSLRAAAEVMKASYGSVKRARTILDHGTARDVADVVAGKTTLNARAIEVRPVRNPRPPRSANGRRPPPVAGDRTLKFINAPPIKSMTQAEVDPEFNGTPIEFTDKYGHVQVTTAEQQATEGFSAWSTNMRALVRKWKELPAISRPVDHNWLRSAKPYDIAKMTEALDFLRPKIAEAEALLARAVATTKQKVS